MFGHRPQLRRRQRRLVAEIAGRWRDGIFQDLVDQIDVGQGRVCVLAVKFDVGDVRAAVKEDILNRCVSGDGILLLQKTQQIGQVGGRAVHRTTVLALAVVQRPKEDFKIGYVLLEFLDLFCAVDKVRNHCRAIPQQVKTIANQRGQDVGILVFGQAIDPERFVVGNALCV